MEWAVKTAFEHKDWQEKETVESLYQSVREFAEDNPQNDDITIMSVRIN